MDYLPKDPAILVSSVRSSSARLLPKGRKNRLLRDEKFLAEDGNPDVEKMELITFDPVFGWEIRWARLSLMANK